MSNRTKLTLVSLATMMLPYRADFLLAVLLLAATGSTVYLWTTKHLARIVSQVMLAGG